MSKYTGTVDRIFLFCKVQQKSGGNALAGAWDFDNGGGDTFGRVLLSTSGNLPATYYGVNTAVDSDMKQGVENAIMNGTPWLIGYKESDGWTWETSLQDIGLQEVGTF